MNKRGMIGLKYINPYENLTEGRWLKVNFHTHAGTGPGTCGANPIDVVVNTYKHLKYDILCISNHDLFSDTRSFSDEKITMVPGVEYSRPEHMLTIGVDRSLHEYDHQTAINITNEIGGFSVLCHPNWGRKGYWNPDKMMELKGYKGIEVLNMLIYRLSGSGLATDAWDFLLSNGRLVYGFGNDDFHALPDAGRSFTVIYAREASYEAMRESIDKGSFCASNGLFPEYLKIEDNIIRVKARFPIATYVDEFTYRFVTENGKVSDVQTGKEGVYKLDGEKYVRVEVVGENGYMLFFQPVYLESYLK